MQWIRKRRPYYVLSSLSLILAIALIVLWHRSNEIYDVLFWWGVDRRGLSLDIHDGELWIERRTAHSNFVINEYLGFHYRQDPIPELSAHDYVLKWCKQHREYFGVLYYEARWNDCDAGGVIVPCVLPLILALVLPLRFGVVLYLNHRWRREMLQKNCCTICGYDLRASADLCPECGAENPRRDAYARARRDRNEMADKTLQLGLRINELPTGRKTT